MKSALRVELVEKGLPAMEAAFGTRRTNISYMLSEAWQRTVVRVEIVEFSRSIDIYSYWSRYGQRCTDKGQQIIIDDVGAGLLADAPSTCAGSEDRSMDDGKGELKHGELNSKIYLNLEEG